MYRRDWLIGACAYRLQQQENVHLLYVCAYYMYALISGYWYALINGIIINTHAIYQIQGKHGKSI